MADDKKIDVLKVEVLDNDVQRYSSTTVTGGGGYVTSVNGRVMGGTNPINSTVQHHVAQEIWVKDLSSGQQIHLILKDSQIPVRPGHHLWIVYDHRSEKWERIVNETTGASTNGNGFTNVNFANKIRRQAIWPYFLAVLLIIPLFNIYIGGPAALAVLIAAWISYSEVPGNRNRSFKTLALGIGLACADLWATATMMESQRSWFVTKVLAVVTVAVLASMFIKTFRALYLATAEMIEERSRRIDAALQQARTK